MTFPKRGSRSGHMRQPESRGMSLVAHRDLTFHTGILSNNLRSFQHIGSVSRLSGETTTRPLSAGTRCTRSAMPLASMHQTRLPKYLYRIIGSSAKGILTLVRQHRFSTIGLPQQRCKSKHACVKPYVQPLGPRVLPLLTAVISPARAKAHPARAI